MRYGDDQCAQCGGIRAAKSTLCIDCLVALVNTYAPAHDIAEAKIKELEEKLRKAIDMYEQLLEHVLDEAMYTHELHIHLWQLRERELIGG